jgi:serine/threonine-protein kinase
MGSDPPPPRSLDRGAELPAGVAVGPWRVEALHGRGASGAVYRVRHPDGRLGALKVLDARLADAADARGRFAREVAVIGCIDHANVAALLDSGALDDGRPYLVSAWVEGENLAQRLARGRLAPDEALAVLAGVADALGAAHAAGVIHRDVKAENVLLGAGPAPASVRLVDFGAARALADDLGLTRAEVAVGTPAAMAPEQLAGGAPSPATDVYALAALAFHALTGERPFAAATGGLDVIAARATPPLASRRVAELPRAVDDVIGQGLALAPEERPESPGALVRALRAAVAGEPAPRLVSVEARALGLVARGGSAAARLALEQAALVAGWHLVRTLDDALVLVHLVRAGAPDPDAAEVARRVSALAPDPALALSTHVDAVRVLRVRGTTQIVGGPLLDLAGWPAKAGI